MTTTPLTSATNDLIIILEQLELHFTIEHFQVRSGSPVADTLVFDILLGPEFIEQFELKVLPNERRVILQRSQTIAMLSSPSKIVNNIVATNNFDNIHVPVSGAEVNSPNRYC